MQRYTFIMLLLQYVIGIINDILTLCNVLLTLSITYISNDIYLHYQWPNDIINDILSLSMTYWHYAMTYLHYHRLTDIIIDSLTLSMTCWHDKWHTNIRFWMLVFLLYWAPPSNALTPPPTLKFVAPPLQVGPTVVRVPVFEIQVENTVLQKSIWNIKY